MPQRILILFAHPAFQKSRVNRRLVEAVQGIDADGVTFHDVYEAYPDFAVDVAREQELLLAHDTIVFQHPFYWYSTPALLKEWTDLVLEHGWAYGHTGDKLHGKRVMSAITTGGGADAYAPGGYNNFSMAQFLAPVEQTVRLCGMEYLPPFLVHGSHSLTKEDIQRHADDYGRVITALRDGRLDLDLAREQGRSNDAATRPKHETANVRG